MVGWLLACLLLACWKNVTVEEQRMIEVFLVGGLVGGWLIAFLCFWLAGWWLLASFLDCWNTANGIMEKCFCWLVGSWLVACFLACNCFYPLLACLENCSVRMECVQDEVIHFVSDGVSVQMLTIGVSVWCQG